MGEEASRKITGYLVNTPHDDVWRIYVNDDCSEFVEVDATDVVDFEATTEQGGAFDPIEVFVRPEAQVTRGKVDLAALEQQLAGDSETVAASELAALEAPRGERPAARTGGWVCWTITISLELKCVPSQRGCPKTAPECGTPGPTLNIACAPQTSPAKCPAPDTTRGPC